MSLEGMEKLGPPSSSLNWVMTTMPSLSLKPLGKYFLAAAASFVHTQTGGSCFPNAASLKESAEGELSLSKRPSTTTLTSVGEDLTCWLRTESMCSAPSSTGGIARSFIWLTTRSYDRSCSKFSTVPSCLSWLSNIFLKMRMVGKPRTPYWCARGWFASSSQFILARVMPFFFRSVAARAYSGANCRQCPHQGVKNSTMMILC
mmetsp:Transcript_10597/g.24908  ORF Transcript_10597/g.24908 Transcript_10597/m.24908 type:complete len:203 (+) Transcript_10597:938-1546(+)